MKTKNLIIILLFFIAVSVNAQLPQTIKDAFKSKYPDETVIRFHKTKYQYFVIFKDGGGKHIAIFNTNGNWVETETKKKWSKIPDPVKQAFNSKYADWRLSKIYRVETSTDTLYKLDIYIDNESGGDGIPNNIEYYVYFTLSGNIVKHVMKY